jgi:hypothetical protein
MGCHQADADQQAGCDKLAANDFAFIRLASIRLWLRVIAR